MPISHLLLALQLAASPGASAFNGTWRQQLAATSARAPKQFVVKVDGNTLALTMTGPGKVSAVDVTFEIGGPEVTYTGLDGDQFRLKVKLEGADLVFQGTEHEDGRDLPVHETWTLKTEGNTRVLVDSKPNKRTTTFAQIHS